ncbi:MAG: lysophospholipase [Arenimonas sp.]|uniref:serine aminopeptidase domain-containing protein n=1 Tax=Arenimonas sp. TaxID=1872635 RepID=UPI0025BCB9E2|nr:alpha/beta hydrolase [Arenimonas sp.]MBW8369030.1 lysophospholipase [Arenimonas sp.]
MRLPKLRHLALAVSLAVAAGCASAPVAPLESSAAAAAPVAASVDVGEIAGAPYRIDIPANWQGDLLLYARGYVPPGTPRESATDRNATDEWALAQGYAIARSDYAALGWSVAEAVEDSERLRAHFVGRHGAPRRTFLMGHSMGSHIALAVLERYPQHYAGALALCGANGPAAELFGDHLMPAVVAFDYFFPGAMGLAPGGLADPASPAWPDMEAMERALQGNEAIARRLAERFDIPRDGLAGGVMIRYAVLHELIQRAGGFPVDNRDVRYTGLGDDAAFNAGVRRYAGDPAAMAYAARHAALTGAAPRPVVMMDNHADPTIPTEVTRRYAALATAAGQGANVVVLPAQGQGHCEFTAEHQQQAMATLAGWVDSGSRPAP